MVNGSTLEQRATFNASPSSPKRLVSGTMANRTLRSRTTDLDEDQTKLNESVVRDQPEQLEFPSTEFTEIGLER
jgi:hypothetical protein